MAMNANSSSHYSKHLLTLSSAGDLLLYSPGRLDFLHPGHLRRCILHDRVDPDRALPDRSINFRK